MKFSLPSAALAMAAAFSLPANAAAQAQRCINSDQVAGIAAAVLPNVITKMSENCAGVLPQGSALRVSGQLAAEQYKESALAARPKAVEAFKIIAGEQLPPNMPVDVVFPFMEAMLFAEIEKANAKEACPIINNLWSALKGLPFENWGLILATIISADRQDKLSKANRRDPDLSVSEDFAVCPYIAMES